MKPTGDVSLSRGLLSESDLNAYFEKLLNELDELGHGDAGPDITDGSVRLDCNGELIDVALIELAVVRKSGSGAELIKFVCPRCDRLHESHRLREARSPMEQR
jgi:hypothetical protein